MVKIMKSEQNFCNVNDLFDSKTKSKYNEAIDRLFSMRLGYIISLDIEGYDSSRIFFRIDSRSLLSQYWSRYNVHLMGISIDELMLKSKQYENRCKNISIFVLKKIKYINTKYIK